MASRARCLTTCLIAVTASAACSNGKLPAGGQGPGQTDPGRLVCPGCATPKELPLGGKTSGFDGFSSADPESGSAKPRPIESELPLSDPSLALLLAQLEGEQELTLRWREGFRDAGLADHAETTTLSLVLTALRAFDVEFDDGSRPTRYLDVQVQLHSGDGALAAAFEHTLDLEPQEGGIDFAASVPDGPAYPLSLAQGWLHFGFQPSLELSAGLHFELESWSRGMRGELSVLVQAPLAPAWPLVTGRFPDDGCGLTEWPLPAGVETYSYDQGVRARFDAVAAALQAAPVQAKPAGASSPSATLELGAPTQFCEASFDIGVYAPLRLQSGDVDLQSDARVELFPDTVRYQPSAELWTRREFIPAQRLAMFLGIAPPASVADSPYLAPRVHADVILAPDTVASALQFELSDSPESSPLQRWCNGELCNP